MAESIKFNLPKVRVRMKTSPAEAFSQDYDSIQLKQYKHNSTMIQQRQKMRRSIQESYIRFRKLKRNNYQRQVCSTKKCVPTIYDEKRLSTITADSKKEEKKKDVSFTLEVQERKTQLQHFMSVKNEREQILTSLIRERVHSPAKQRKSGLEKGTSKPYYFSNKDSLNASPTEEDLFIELEGKKLSYIDSKESKSKLLNIKKFKKINHAPKENIGKYSQFRIDPWRDSGSGLNNSEQSF